MGFEPPTPGTRPQAATQPPPSYPGQLQGTAAPPAAADPAGAPGAESATPPPPDAAAPQGPSQAVATPSSGGAVDHADGPAATASDEGIIKAMHAGSPEDGEGDAEEEMATLGNLFDDSAAYGTGTATSSEGDGDWGALEDDVPEQHEVCSPQKMKMGKAWCLAFALAPDGAIALCLMCDI